MKMKLEEFNELMETYMSLTSYLEFEKELKDNDHDRVEITISSYGGKTISMPTRTKYLTDLFNSVKYDIAHTYEILESNGVIDRFKATSIPLGLDSKAKILSVLLNASNLYTEYTSIYNSIKEMENHSDSKLAMSFNATIQNNITKRISKLFNKSYNSYQEAIDSFDDQYECIHFLMDSLVEL